MRTSRFVFIACLAVGVTTASAQDYSEFLTSARGFNEVTSMEGFTGNATDCYILASAENTGLIVGVGSYKEKPDWASEESKALRYVSAGIDPVLDLTNFFTIEKSGSYIGLRNMVYSADMFQTHNGLGFMYVNTFTDKNLDEWSYLIPTYQDDYWFLENGMYPMSSGEEYSGFLGPWNKSIAEGEPMALNRKNTVDDAAGHYRIFRIAREDLMAMYTSKKREQLLTATASNPVDATWLIINPSFETGDETGWKLIGKDSNGNDEFKTRDYGMSGKEGGYLMNAYQWWATSMFVSQTVNNLPSGVYELSGVVCTWAGRTVTFTGNETTISKTGVDDQTGIPVSMSLTIGNSQKLVISAGSFAQWWENGHSDETQTFFKLDDVRLTCKGLFLNGYAQPLPNDNSTKLEPYQWYYYDADYPSDYRLKGNLDDMVYSTDGDKFLADINTSEPKHDMILQKGRHYFLTTRSDATLTISEKRMTEEGTFNAVALNVDGLPESILFVTLNEDGPQASGTKLISKYLNAKQYNLIGFSEDFNFDTELRSAMTGYSWGTHRGKVSSLSNNTDGLQCAWNSRVSLTNESWTKYNSVANTDGNQYIKKGYRHYDMTVDNNLIDVYITHMDAGNNTDAINSRSSQWAQLTEAINAADAKRPKLIIGDTNCRWTRDGIKENFLDKLNNNLTASDVWVELYRDGVYPTKGMGDLGDKSDPWNFTNYEIVDKIIYINPKEANTLQLVPQSFKIEQDYIYAEVDGTDNGTPLGDHKPVVVEFKYIKPSALIGDVNHDGYVNIVDVVEIVNYILGRPSADFDVTVANLNGDQEVTVADAVTVLDMILP